MKIVHAVYSLEMGGAEVLVGQLCRLQRAEGHDVSVVAYAMLGVVGEAIEADGFQVTVLGKAHPLVTMARYVKLLRERKPDVLHCHNAAATTQAALSARIAGVPKVITTRHRLDPLPYDVPLEVKYSLAGRFCDWMTGICETTCEGLRNAPLANTKKIVRVYNGTRPVERVSTDHLRKKGFTILFIGRVAAEKDLATLIRAVQLAVGRVPELEFWIVGDGWIRPELEALAREIGVEDHVRFWGQRMDTAQFFSAADAFVMASITEGLPMSLLQAMSLGLPAILTDVDGGAEVARMAGSGLLVPLRDPAAMADAIVRLAGDRALQEELSRNALAAYEREFTLEKMAAGYMSLYSGARP